MDNEKLQELVNQFIGGDKEAFEEIYNETYNFVYFSCYSVLKSKEDAEDLAQEVYVTVYNKLEEYKNNGKFLGWLKTIAANKSIDYLRKKNRMPEIDQYEDFNETDFKDDNLENIPSYYIDQAEKRKIFEKIMKENLSDVQFNTLFFHYYNELPVEEIARLMACPEGTVKTRLKKARQILKEKVSEYEKEFDISLAAVGGVPFLTKYFTEVARTTHLNRIPPIKIPNGVLGSAYKGAAKASVGKVIIASIAGVALVSAGVMLFIQNSDNKINDDVLISQDIYKINLNDYTSMDIISNKKSVDVNGSFNYAEVNKAVSENLNNDSEFDIKSYISWNSASGFNMVNGDTLEWKWTVDEEALNLFESQNNIDIVYSDYVYEVKGQDFGDYNILNSINLQYDLLEDDKALNTADYIICSNITLQKEGNCPKLPGLKITVDGFTDNELKTNTFKTGDDLVLRLELTDNNYNSVEEYCKSKGFSSVTESKVISIGHKEYETTAEMIRKNPQKNIGYNMKDFMDNIHMPNGSAYILLVRKEEYNDIPTYIDFADTKFYTDGRMYIQPYLLISISLDKWDKGDAAVEIKGPFSESFFTRWDEFDGFSMKTTKKNVMKYIVGPIEKFYDIEYLE